MHRLQVSRLRLQNVCADSRDLQQLQLINTFDGCFASFIPQYSTHIETCSDAYIDSQVSRLKLQSVWYRVVRSVLVAINRDAASRVSYRLVTRDGESHIHRYRRKFQYVRMRIDAIINAAVGVCYLDFSLVAVFFLYCICNNLKRNGAQQKCGKIETYCLNPCRYLFGIINVGN